MKIQKKKRLEICKKSNIEESKIDASPNISNESIRISSKIKNKLKIWDEDGYKKINWETKNSIIPYL